MSLTRLPNLIRAQCRQELFRLSTKNTPITHPVRWRSGVRKKVPPSSSKIERQHDIPPERKSKPTLSPGTVADYLSQNVYEWRSLRGAPVADRLYRFGVPRRFVRSLLNKYSEEMELGTVFVHLAYDEKRLARIATDLSNDSGLTDRYYTKILYEWASLSQGRESLLQVVPPEVVSRMEDLFRASDLMDMGWRFAVTRRAPPRKFIMHVGPTNSGKTHNALRALAAAKRGVYAGPLRLLAYEIYDRLNKGQIVPLGVEASPTDEPDTQMSADLGEIPGKGKDVAVTRMGNPKYVRPCNMLTGEEQKIAMEGAALLSCTIEMTPLTNFWDVAVIDEIQLIADKQRGGAWTDAVIGLNAREIHLCGEEAAVPLITAIVEELGDTVEVHRYQRLTPLAVAKKSLDGDLQQIKKGDCVVTFSRSTLFETKRAIEEKTKLRCAIAYGRLPPEIRNEQAALFNDPNSGYDVLVGSDAIGMGLNLKIKRIIFEKVQKFDGSGKRFLSAPAIKQIAGRAGRFGMHEKDSVGIVTTLHPQDLEVVRDAVAAPPQPLRYARYNMAAKNFYDIVSALPVNARTQTIDDVFQYVAREHPLFETLDSDQNDLSSRFINGFMDVLPLFARLLVQLSPCPWRDGAAVTGARSMMEIHRDKLTVSAEEMLYRSGHLENLNKVLALMEGHGLSPSTKEIFMTLAQLETVHKVVVLYLWFSYRYPVAFPDQAQAFQFRQLTELAMDWCLEYLHQLRLKTHDATQSARRAVLKRRPLEDIDEKADVTTQSAPSLLDGTLWAPANLENNEFIVNIAR